LSATTRVKSEAYPTRTWRFKESLAPTQDNLTIWMLRAIVRLSEAWNSEQATERVFEPGEASGLFRFVTYDVVMFALVIGPSFLGAISGLAVGPTVDNLFPALRSGLKVSLFTFPSFSSFDIKPLQGD
jgi:hypothetical protein